MRPSASPRPIGLGAVFLYGIDTVKSRVISLFGSRLKGTARPDSDFDLLVEFMPEARPTLLH